MIFLFVPWVCFLLWRIRRPYVFHPNELPVILALHAILLIHFTMTLIDTPYASSGFSQNEEGRFFGMPRLLWNPRLYVCANGALLLIPTGWTIWIQHRQVHLSMLIIQLLLLGGLVYWLGFAQLPTNPCDYSNPKLLRLGICA